MRRRRDAVFVRFTYRANWFVLCQTEGEPIEILTTPDWDRSKALSTLSISEVPFEHMDGNCMGYARRREIAISPLNQMPHKTTFHELAHLCWLEGYVVPGLQLIDCGKHSASDTT